MPFHHRAFHSTPLIRNLATFRNIPIGEPIPETPPKPKRVISRNIGTVIIASMFYNDIIGNLPASEVPLVQPSIWNEDADPTGWFGL